MTSEEQGAIEQLKEIKEDAIFLNNHWYEEIGDNDIQAIDTILNLIERQKKEIEKLKFNNHVVEKWNEYLDKECISKDKIREKIKELEEQMQQDEVDEFGIHSIGWGTLDYVVEQFKELLEEK